MPVRLATEPVVQQWPIEQITRDGAPRALQRAIEDQVADRIDAHRDCLDDSCRGMVVRNGHKPPRTVLSELGLIAVT